jgi:transposase
MEELGIECRVGHPATIRAVAPRKQKNDRLDADLILKLLAENRFPAIWLPTKELLDLRALVLHRHQWVRIRTRIPNALQAIALANGLRRGPSLWSYDGQAKIAFLPLLPHASYRRAYSAGILQWRTAAIRWSDQTRPSTVALPVV